MHRAILLATFTFGLSTGFSAAALVLTIDISNPSSTVITAVINNSQNAGNLDVNFNGGISFREFFSADESITIGAPVVITGTWTARGTASSYNEMVTFIYGNSAVVPGRDLSIYNVDALNGNDQNFVTNEAPFSGSSTLDLSSFLNLPAVGTTGDVYIGYQASHGGVIGQWEVIPEPSALLLASTGLVGLLRRRR